MLLLYSVVAFVTATSIKTGSGIRCYVCNSKQDQRCSDPFNSTKILDMKSVDCTMDPSSSRSALETVGNLLTRLGQTPGASDDGNITDLSTHISTSCQKLELRVMGELVTERGCAGPVQNNLNPCDRVKLLVTENLQMEYCGFCNIDDCNRALIHSTSNIALTSSLIIAVWHLAD